MFFYKPGNISECFAPMEQTFLDPACQPDPITENGTQFLLGDALHVGTKAMDVLCVVITITNVILNLLCLVIFFVVWRDKKKTSIHTALLYLSLSEAIYQTMATIRVFDIIKEVNPMESIYSLEIAQTKKILELAFYSTRNWWVALIAVCRAYFVSESSTRNVACELTMPRTGLAFLAVNSLTFVFVFTAHMVGHISSVVECPSMFDPMYNKTQPPFLKVSDPSGVLSHALQYTFWVSNVAIPFLIILVSSILIWKTIVQNAYGGGQRYTRVAVIIGTITAIFLFLEGPSFFVFVINISPLSHCASMKLNRAIPFIEILANLNSLGNVFVYLCADNVFRDTFSRLVRGQHRYTSLPLSEVSRPKDAVSDATRETPI